jgi:hypothetical protein
MVPLNRSNNLSGWRGTPILRESDLDMSVIWNEEDGTWDRMNHETGEWDTLRAGDVGYEFISLLEGKTTGEQIVEQLESLPNDMARLEALAQVEKWRLVHMPESEARHE